MSIFVKKVRRACHSSRSLVCVGLDPDPALMPVSDVYEFNRAIIDATAGVTCAYKPNLAFTKRWG